MALVLNLLYHFLKLKNIHLMHKTLWKKKNYIEIKNYFIHLFIQFGLKC